ncbi:MAG: thiopurine S-methyltransferase [Proteobacteria bacterium]|nr:MAG: thiopurine S-methyltransferase [Pseudomonadota bacterium]
MLDWEDLYQQGDTGWDRGMISPALQHWFDTNELKAGQRVLIPGCGRGYEVIALAKRGFEVTALDLAPSAIDAVKQGLQEAGLSATLVCSDLFDYQPKQGFDVIYEQTCLCALPVERREDYEQCLFSWLKRDGILCFSMMQTGEQGGPPFHCDWLDMKVLFSEKRWQWPGEPPIFIPRPSGLRFELGFMLHSQKAK